MSSIAHAADALRRKKAERKKKKKREEEKEEGKREREDFFANVDAFCHFISFSKQILYSMFTSLYLSIASSPLHIHPFIMSKSALICKRFYIINGLNFFQ